MRLAFRQPKKFMFHFSKPKGKINLFVYEERDRPQCFEVEQVMQCGTSCETKEVPTASLSITRGAARTIIIDKETATLIP
jgi:hypothetical protein